MLIWGRLLFESSVNVHSLALTAQEPAPKLREDMQKQREVEEECPCHHGYPNGVLLGLCAE